MSTIKTAISIEKNLFNQADKLAHEFHISRSQLFSQAIEYFINKKNNLELLRKLNEAYSDVLTDINESKDNKQIKTKYKQTFKEKW